MKPLEDCRLYTFIDTAYLRGRDPVKIGEALCAGGSDLIQIRAKDTSKEFVRTMALDILPITRAAGVYLVINDHLDIAQEIGADICHLGQEDFFEAGFTHIRELPQLAGKPQPKIGLSTHSPGQAARAVVAGADYIAIGPVYPTGTKPTAKAVTLDYVRWAAETVQEPWFAIGGINLQNLPEILGAGAKRICVVSAILNEVDVTRVTRQFRNSLPS